MGEYTYKKEESSNLIKEGSYEATIEKIEKKKFDSGAEKMQITWRIRSDIEQSYKNKCVFEDIWRDKQEPTCFNKRRINQLLGTQDLPEGTKFTDDKSLFDFLIGKNAVINVKIVFDDYKQEDINRISYYRSSEHKPQQLGVIAPTSYTTQQPYESVYKNESVNQSPTRFNNDEFELTDDLPF